MATKCCFVKYPNCGNILVQEYKENKWVGLWFRLDRLRFKKK